MRLGRDQRAGMHIAYAGGGLAHAVYGTSNFIRAAAVS